MAFTEKDMQAQNSAQRGRLSRSTRRCAQGHGAHGRRFQQRGGDDAEVEALSLPKRPSNQKRKPPLINRPSGKALRWPPRCRPSLIFKIGERYGSGSSWNWEASPAWAYRHMHTSINFIFAKLQRRAKDSALDYIKQVEKGAGGSEGSGRYVEQSRRAAEKGKYGDVQELQGQGWFVRRTAAEELSKVEGYITDAKRAAGAGQSEDVWRIKKSSGEYEFTS